MKPRKRIFLPSPVRPVTKKIPVIKNEDEADDEMPQLTPELPFPEVDEDVTVTVAPAHEDKKRTSHISQASGSEYAEVSYSEEDSEASLVDFKVKPSGSKAKKSKAKPQPTKLAVASRRRKPVCKLPYQCDLCEAEFTTQKKFRKHYKREHQKNLPVKLWRSRTAVKYTCTTCKKSFDDKRKFEDHRKRHKNGKKKVGSGSGSGSRSRPRLSCEDCETTFSLPHHLKRHRKRFHEGGEEEIRCFICDAAFKSEQELKRHIGTIHGEAHFQCTLCSTSCNRKDNLKRHYTRCHEGEPFPNITATRVEVEAESEEPRIKPKPIKRVKREPEPEDEDEIQIMDISEDETIIHAGIPLSTSVPVRDALEEHDQSSQLTELIQSSPGEREPSEVSEEEIATSVADYQDTSSSSDGVDHEKLKNSFESGDDGFSTESGEIGGIDASQDQEEDIDSNMDSDFMASAPIPDALGEQDSSEFLPETREPSEVSEDETAGSVADLTDYQDSSSVDHEELQNSFSVDDDRISIESADIEDSQEDTDMNSVSDFMMSTPIPNVLGEHDQYKLFPETREPSEVSEEEIAASVSVADYQDLDSCSSSVHDYEDNDRLSTERGDMGASQEEAMNSDSDFMMSTPIPVAFDDEDEKYEEVSSGKPTSEVEVAEDIFWSQDEPERINLWSPSLPIAFNIAEQGLEDADNEDSEPLSDTDTQMARDIGNIASSIRERLRAEEELEQMKNYELSQLSNNCGSTASTSNVNALINANMNFEYQYQNVCDVDMRNLNGAAETEGSGSCCGQSESEEVVEYPKKCMCENCEKGKSTQPEPAESPSNNYRVRPNPKDKVTVKANNANPNKGASFAEINLPRLMRPNDKVCSIQ